jgi:hypothetical protein
VQQNPFDQFDNSPMLGPPRLPPMQTPGQVVGQDLQNTKNQLDIQNNPLTVANTKTNIQQGQASIQNQHFNQVQGLRQEFNNLPEIKNYSVALQSLGTALKAPDTPQGDLSVIYAYAKAADPGSVVREGEMDMATNTASLPDKYRVMAEQVTQGKRLPPAVRTGLIETMRQSVSGLRSVYDQQRNRYATLAQQNGVSPDQIIGQPLYDAYRPAEEAYIRTHGGTPRDPNAPLQVAPSQAEAGFGLQQDPRNTSLSPEQAKAYDAWFAAHSNPTPEQLVSFVKSLGIPGDMPINNAKAIIAAVKNHASISHDVQINPNISDVRGGNNTPTQDTVNAVARGVPDALSLGTIDKAVALGDTVFKGGTFDQNLQRQYAISDYDQQNHPFARLAGQALGGSVLPMGEVSGVGNLAAKGAAYGGGYGLGSSRQLSDIPANVLGGAAVGAAVPAALGRFLRPTPSAGVDPLVDPVTGELNQPMQSMTAPQRLQMMRDYGLTNVSPGMAGGRTARVIEQGLNNVPGSAGVMEDFNQAASGEVRRVMQGVAQKFGQSKTLNEAGTQLQEGARNYISRFKDVSSKAYNAIPISDQAPASTSSTLATLGDLTSRFQSNPQLAGMMANPKLQGYMAALQKGGISWKDLKDFRSIIGDKIGEARFSDDPSTRDLRALYGSLSEDMQNTAAANGPKAVAAFNRANDLYRQGQQRIDQALVSILGDNGMKSPEAAAAMVQTLTRGGKGSGDLAKLAQIRASTIKSGAWDEVASTLIHLGGQPANSEGRAFNPQTFVNWYADMSEPARAMLFKPEQRKALDGFVAIAQQLGRVKGLSNTSNTTPTMIGSGVVAASGLAAISHPSALLGLMGAGAANYGTAKLWTNPTFVNLVTGYSKAALSRNQNAVKSQVGRLAKFAATNPEFSEPVQSILRQIANDNTIPGVAASSNADQKQQQQ